MGQGSVTECTNLILTQSIDQKVRNIMNSLSENKTTMENDIVQKAKNNLQNSLKQVNDGLNLGQMNFNNQAQSVIAESEVKIEQRVRNIIETSLSTWNENSQKLEITLNGTLRGEQCNFSQSIISNVISENISKGIQDTISKTKSYQSIINDLQNKATQKNIGLFGGAGGLLLLVIIVLMMSKKSSNKNRQYSSFQRQNPQNLPYQSFNKRNRNRKRVKKSKK